jgi:tetratricopeptide (TPR) repeat protein
MASNANLNQKLWMVHYNNAKAYSRRGDVSTAFDFYKKALELMEPLKDLFEKDTSFLIRYSKTKYFINLFEHGLQPSALVRSK